MGSDATAAGYLAGAQKLADTIGAYTAGVQLRSSLQKIDLASQASQIDTIMNVVKLQNDQADARRKDELAKQTLDIARYNAETNRLNATRPLKGTAAATTGGGISDLMGFDENGLYLKGSGEVAAPAAGAPAPQVAATPQPGGNGLGTHVPGYDPFAVPDEQAAAQQVTDQQGASLFPQGGSMQDAGAGMNAPSMPGQPQRSAANNGRIYFDVDNIGINAKGQPTMSLKRRGAGQDPLPAIPTPQQLAALSAPYAHLGKRAVPDANNKRGFVFEDIPTMKGADLSISTLPAETQKGLLTDVNELISLGAQGGPSDIQKMEAMGITVEKDASGEPTAAGIQKAGQEMRDRGLSWSDAFVRAQTQRDNDLIAKAATYANKLNAEMHGKPGWQNKTALDVFNDIGLKVPASIVSQQLGAQPAGRSVSVAQSGQAGGPAGTVPPRSPFLQPGVTPEDGIQISALQKEIATEKDPAVKAVKEKALAQLTGAQPQGGAAGASAAASGKPLSRSEIIQQLATPSASENAAATAGQTDSARWETAKQAVLGDVLKAGGRDLAKNLLTDSAAFKGAAKSVGGLFMGSGQTAKIKQRQWIEKNISKISLKPKDGKELTADSVIFTDASGRDIKLGEIINAAFEDQDIKNAIGAPAVQQAGANRPDMSADAKAVLEQHIK